MDEQRSDDLDLSGLREHAQAILRAEEASAAMAHDELPPPVNWAEVRSLRGVSIAARATLLAWVPFSVLAVLANLSQRSLLERFRDDPSSVRWSEVVADSDRIDLVNTLSIALLLVTAVCFVAWFFVAYSNLEPLRLAHRWTMGWAIGAWFVPVLCWWRPKQLADDVWGSVDRERRARGRTPSRAVPNAWWAAWIAAFVVAFVAAGAEGSAERAAQGSSLTGYVDEAMRANASYTVRAVLLGVAAVLAFFVVRAVSRAQAKPADASTTAPIPRWGRGSVRDSAR